MFPQINSGIMKRTLVVSIVPAAFPSIINADRALALSQ